MSADLTELRQLERRADEYGLWMHHSDADAMRWLQTIRQAADLRTRIDPVAFERHIAAMRVQGITAKQADDMFYRLSRNLFSVAA